jgi:hypothetical protein
MCKGLVGHQPVVLSSTPVSAHVREREVVKGQNKCVLIEIYAPLAKARVGARMVVRKITPNTIEKRVTNFYGRGRGQGGIGVDKLKSSEAVICW